MTTIYAISGETVADSALRAVNAALSASACITLERCGTACVVAPADSVGQAATKYQAALVSGNHASSS